jgi:hypothetical protein
MSPLHSLLERLLQQRILENYEMVQVSGPTGKTQTIRAKIDTGANRTSLDKTIAHELDLLEPSNITQQREFFSGLGREVRPMVKCTLVIRHQAHPTSVSVSDRSHMTHKMIIGRQDIQGWLVKPAKQAE